MSCRADHLGVYAYRSYHARQDGRVILFWGGGGTRVIKLLQGGESIESVGNRERGGAALGTRGSNATRTIVYSV